MFQITQENTIYISRGDSAKFGVWLTTNSETCWRHKYKMKETDKVYFAIMEPNQKFEDAIVKKCLTISDLGDRGDIVVKLDSKDTEKLNTGLYYYQVKLVIEPNNINTIVKKSKFYVV